MSRADDGAGAPAPGSSYDPVDLDRLADYAAGVLDQTAAAEVERRVRTDDRWARALEALQVADEAVRAELHDLATSHPVQMPADVASRIEDALREIAPESSVVSLATARAKRQVGHRRFVTGITPAAATLVLVLCGITLVRGGPQNDAATSAGAPAPAQAENGDRGAGGNPALVTDDGSIVAAAVLVVSTGTNYTSQALRTFPRYSARVPLSTDAGQKDSQHPFSEPVVPGAVAQAAPRPLSRLTGKAALAACLKAIRDTHPGAPTVIDYAQYEGRPALIVSVVQTGGPTTVVVVGGSCGLSGPDEITAVTQP